MRVDLELLGKDMLGVRFDYDAFLVARLKKLQKRKWKPAEKRWHVHLAHLREVIEIFHLEEKDVAAPIRTAFKKKWSGPRRLIVQLGTLHGKIEGIGAPVEEIDEEASFHVPGYKFSPKFQLKKWDGKRHLFDRNTMKFPAGLWPRVKAVLERSGSAYDLEVEPATESRHVEFQTETTPLRDYQTSTVETAAEKGRGIIQIATGGGKTLVAAHLIRRLGKPTFFFVHTRELLYQTKQVFEKELGGPIGQLGDGIVDLANVTVATLQTSARAFGLTVPRESSAEEDEGGAKEKSTPVASRKEEILAAVGEAGVVIFDECHHVPADTAYRVAFRTPGAANRFGLSATPWRDDRHDLLLEAALGEKICAITSSDLIERKYLVRPHIVMEQAPSPQFRGRRMPYADIYKAAIVENLARNRVIATRCREMVTQGLSILILVAQIQHGHALQELLPEAQFVYGSLEMDLRRRYIDELERKLHPVLIATTLADEGLDVPSLGGVILAGGGKSATKAYQRIGRALRPAPGKEKAWVLDFFDRVRYLDEHSLSRLDLYRAEPGFEIETRGFKI